MKDLPAGGRPATLIWLRRRFTCTNCDERHTETHPMIAAKMTKRLMRAIENDARQLTITEIARRYGPAATEDVSEELGVDLDAELEKSETGSMFKH